MPVLVFLAMGSNLGDRRANLRAAAAALPPEVTVLEASPVYETEPWGYAEQPAFFNQVLKGETQLPPFALLMHLKQIETQLGRVPTIRYGPRCIDLDILFYGDQVVQSPELTIPHPRLAERAFVLVPLADLAPELRHPQSQKTVAAMLSEVGHAGIRQT
ncbi:MAG: 2-amino-4-hydroxy-6-hydroxymethyldihydropteridine diphosphokinase [Chloroflexota bacterium]